MSEVRKHYTSRFENGRILELDFSQLEIYVLAFLSQDSQLIDDLLSGADLHGISAENLFGAMYTKAHRKIAKQLSFQLQYGAGAKSMAASNDILITTARKFIKNYYERYPQVKAFQDRMIEEVEKLRETSEKRTKKGLPAGVAKWQSLSGRIYTFVEQDAPSFVDKEASFSPTQIKNYPTQGFATGDIVPLVVGKLYRRLLDWSNEIADPVLMIGTVHDSVVFDCANKSVAKLWAKEAKKVMEMAPEYVREVFGIEFNLPLRVEAEYGENWHDMVELDLT